MNSKTNLSIALAAALLLAFGTGCASIVREPPVPNPAPDINVPPKLDAESVTATAEPSAPSPEPVAAAEKPSTPSPEPVATAEKPSAPLPEPVASTPKPASKRVPQPENVGLLSKTPVAQPPPTKPDGSLTRLDEMKKQGTMSEEAYGQIRRQILENPE